MYCILAFAKNGVKQECSFLPNLMERTRHFLGVATSRCNVDVGRLLVPTDNRHNYYLRNISKSKLMTTIEKTPALGKKEGTAAKGNQ